MEKRWKTPQMTAMLAALLCGTGTHLFGLVNILHNYDDIAQLPTGYGAGVTSGRWLLSLLGDLMDKLGGNYNLPLVNGVLFLVLIGLAAGLLADIFEIRSRVHAALLGTVMVVFPSAFSTLLFRYTAVYYGLGIVLAVLAAWTPERVKFGWLLSALCTACSMGIYQAYVPITITIFVLRLLQLELLGFDWKRFVRQGLSCCGALLLGLGLYLLLMKGTLALYGTQLSDYQGVDQMGVLTLKKLPQLVKKAYYFSAWMPVKNFWGLASSPFLKLAYGLSELVSVGLVLWLLVEKKRGWDAWLLCGLLGLLLPLAVSFVIIMCPESDIYTLMVYAYVLVPCIPMILLTCFERQRRRVEQVVVVLLALICGCYGYSTNVNYSALYFSNRQIENYVNGLVTQVRMTEGFDAEKKWAFLGVIDDPLLSCYWQYEMDYGGEEFTGPMLRRYSWDAWMWNYCGYMPPLAEETEVSALFETEEVKAMPCWPSQGSIRVIGDTVVIKFSETNVKPN